MCSSDLVARVVEVLEADRSDQPEWVPPVHLDLRTPVPVDSATRAVTDAELIVDGTPHRVEVGPDGIVLPDDLPYGCHSLTVDGGATSAESVVVVAPSHAPGSDPARRRSSLFAPAYALWDDDEPLPSFGLLRRLARAIAADGIDTISTLPLYATFLDDPFDPSPYSPISRLHWNEALLDDAALPDVTASSADAVDGENVDWRRLGERRRQQLLRAAIDADDDLVSALARFSAAHPDVGSYARFRAGRESGGDLIVERSHVLGQYLADQQLDALGTDEAAAGLSLDLPIGSHPDGWETWAHPTLFAEAMSGGYRALDELRRNGDVQAIGLGVNEREVCLAAMQRGDWDCFLLAGRYTLLEQDPLDDLFPSCERSGTGIILGGPYNSGILVGGSTWNYAEAPPDVVERVRRIEAVCDSHDVPLPAAALQFPLGSKLVASVIPGPRSRAEARQNIEWFRHEIPAALWSDLAAEGLLAEDAPLPG